MRQTWEEIVKQYPDKWVALSDVVFDGSDVASGIVEANCIDSEIGTYDTELINKGIQAFWIRTTDLEGANALCQNN